MEQYKFQKLEVYQLGIKYVDEVYGLSRKLPQSERFNLSSQIERAATSIVLNIAEGSTGQSNPEQKQGHQLFIKLAAFRNSFRS